MKLVFLCRDTQDISGSAQNQTHNSGVSFGHRINKLMSGKSPSSSHVWHKYQYHLTVQIFTQKNCANYTITNICPVFFSCPLRGSIPQAHVSPIRNHVLILANFLPCASTLHSSQPTSSELNQTTERELGGQGWGILKGSMLQQSF